MGVEGAGKGPKGRHGDSTVETAGTVSIGAMVEDRHR